MTSSSGCVRAASSSLTTRRLPSSATSRARDTATSASHLASGTEYDWALVRRARRVRIFRDHRVSSTTRSSQTATIIVEDRESAATARACRARLGRAEEELVQLSAPTPRRNAHDSCCRSTSALMIRGGYSEPGGSPADGRSPHRPGASAMDGRSVVLHPPLGSQGCVLDRGRCCSGPRGSAGSRWAAGYAPFNLHERFSVIARQRRHAALAVRRSALRLRGAAVRTLPSDVGGHGRWTNRRGVRTRETRQAADELLRTRAPSGPAGVRRSSHSLNGGVGPQRAR